MSADELRKAADKIGSRKNPSLESARLDVAIAKWLARTADVVTTITVLDEAGVDLLILDGAKEAHAVARLINGGAS